MKEIIEKLLLTDAMLFVFLFCASKGWDNGDESYWYQGFICAWGFTWILLFVLAVVLVWA